MSHSWYMSHSMVAADHPSSKKTFEETTRKP
jgi:hypothetical protein